VLSLRAMGMFDDPATLKSALELALTDELKLSELRYVFGSALSRPATSSVFYAWEKESWPRLRTRIPGSLGRGALVDVVGNLCSAQERDDARAFLEPATQGLEGVKRALEEGFEQADLCIALREHSAADLTAYFRRK